MPTQIIQYQCMKCFQTYLNEQTAIDCESKHFKLNDFTIVHISGRSGAKSNLFPVVIHVADKNTNKIAFYELCHDEVKPSKNHRGYRFYSAIFPSEEEAE